MRPLGQYPAARHVVAHISDTHFLGGSRPLYGSVPTDAHLTQALSQLEASGARPEAIVFTGDLADLGEPDAYSRLRALVEPFADRLGAQVIWVMGNHDERRQYSAALFDSASTEEPQDRVYNIGGLRIISLDTSVPGYHHGDLTQAQLDWLADELATPAPHGTLLAMHHPPIPTPLLEAMGMLELQDQSRLADVIRGAGSRDSDDGSSDGGSSEVHAILAGHLHYSTHSMFSGIPVSVAAATCYTLDLTARDRILSGVDFGQAFNLVHVYEDRVVHSIVPVGDTAEVTGFSAEHWAQIEAMTPEERREMFSNKNSPFNSPGSTLSG